MGVMKYFRHILMGHEIYFKIFDIAITEIYERQDMLNKSHPLSRYKANSGKNFKKKCLMYFEPDARAFVLSNWHKIQLCDKFSSVIFICLIPFSQLQFGVTGCMILMKEYVSMTTAAMKMNKKYFRSDHSNGC